MGPASQAITHCIAASFCYHGLGPRSGPRCRSSAPAQQGAAPENMQPQQGRRRKNTRPNKVRAGKAHAPNKADAVVTHPCDKVHNTHGVCSMHVHGLGPRSGPASEASKNMPREKHGPPHSAQLPPENLAAVGRIKIKKREDHSSLLEFIEPIRRIRREPH